MSASDNMFPEGGMNLFDPLGVGIDDPLSPMASAAPDIPELAQPELAGMTGADPFASGSGFEDLPEPPIPDEMSLPAELPGVEMGGGVPEPLGMPESGMDLAPEPMSLEVGLPPELPGLGFEAGLPPGMAEMDFTPEPPPELPSAVTDLSTGWEKAGVRAARRYRVTTTFEVPDPNEGR